MKCLVFAYLLFLVLPLKAETEKDLMIDEMQAEIVALKKRLSQVEKTCNEQWQSIADTDVKEKRFLLSEVGDITPKIAFDAILTHNLDHTGLADMSIVFDQVLTNYGDAYSKDIGIFIAPFHGAYLFSYTIHGDYASSVVSSLVVNGVRKTVIHIDGSLSGQSLFSPSASRTSILSLRQNDKVYVQITTNTRGLVISDQYRHSAFAGVLLFTDDSY